jgi:ubiquinone/menaquinone biosynthesis C-methylase UbiE
MTDRDELVAADYFLAVLGLAMTRTILRRPSAAVPRRHEIEQVLASLDDPLYAARIPFSTHDVHEGYTTWAPVYDAPGNPVIANEEPAVHALLEGAPRGRALDAACGTGRHAAHLAALGYDVVGVDATEAMLAVARAKVPSAEFHTGRLEALLMPDESVDVVTCGLALEHVDNLGVVCKEFARVLRPGGWLVCSDTHPIMRELGTGAFVPAALGEALQLVRGHQTHMHDYLDAFAAAGLTVGRCVEPVVNEQTLASFPTSAFFPDASRQAWFGLPHLLIWQAVKNTK